MFTRRARIAVMTVAAALGTWRWWTGDPTGAWFLVAAALLAYGHFRYGTVWLAFRALRKGDVDRAGSFLNQVARPGMLSPESRAYYFMVFGLVAASRGQLGEAESALRKALALPLRTENDRALVEVALAELLVTSTSPNEARELLALAAGRATKPVVSKEVERVTALLGT
ncbi:MAG: hypothetical protein ABMA15_23040 [Vicinamibacterales bacterium]